MVAPRLTPIEDAPPSIVSSLPRLPQGPDVQVFMVVRGGHCLSGRWRVGDVIVCRGEASTGDDVVLLAGGLGRPQLGRVEGIRLLGVLGEPCHPARWRVAGKITLTFRQQRDGWMVELRGRAPRSVIEGQLSLFSAQAA